MSGVANWTEGETVQYDLKLMDIILNKFIFYFFSSYFYYCDDKACVQSSYETFSKKLSQCISKF